MNFISLKKLLITLPRSVKRGLAVSSDLAICVISVWFAFVLRLDQWHFIFGNQWRVTCLAVVISIPIFYYFGLYRSIFRHVGTRAFASIINVFVIYSLIFFCVVSLVGLDGVPRSIGVIQPILLFIGIGVSRYSARRWLDNILKLDGITSHGPRKALVYGAGAAGRQLAAALSINEEIPIIGFLDDDRSLHGNVSNGFKIYAPDDLKKFRNELDVTDVFLAIPSASQSRRNEIISALSHFGFRVRSLPGLSDMISGPVRFSGLHNLNVNHLLNRELVSPDVNLLKKNIENKVVLVTGAGGSIGSELCRQIIKFSPKLLVLIDSSEYALYQIYEELRSKQPTILGEAFDSNFLRESSAQIIPRLASVRDRDMILKIFSTYEPETVFHAAAYKHVPLVEQNAIEAIRNNVYGTLYCAEASLKHDAKHFILVSTDKAVRPTNVMGASKRIAELILQAMSARFTGNHDKTIFSMVRFGNVLDSSGSVIPLFRSQIASGGPVTLTHPEVTRYFMTIPEAAQLVIQASAMSTGGDVFVLDMGKPVRIYDLASKMIYLSGLTIKDEFYSSGDIEIKVTGLRPGEKLYEELLIGDDIQLTDHPRIMKAQEDFLHWNELELSLAKLSQVLDADDFSNIQLHLKELVTGYQPSNNIDSNMT